ncbi:CoA transferase [Variovorax sp. J22R133]|uniref:CaiB/BaiF CoA transferase family protein n=1 Tax=Variovorax brevis TaxID=3053503 RepID=UPI002578E406|nr:CoA transferase [Variovorax sp. J22R133]MDM0117023.1 CoA transferase [Variovorax sp. J22R133]
MRHALDGLTVVDFTQIGAGPTCTMLLADLGARVIKVESPAGDIGRTLGPGWVGEDAALYHGFNRNKLGMALDFKTPEGLEIAKRLIATADIVVESMRPGVMQRAGLAHAQLQARHPALIYCSISAYGQEGPYAQRAGVDGVLQADSGLMSLIGTPGGEPCKVQAPVVDVTTGYLACIAILAKLQQRSRDGQGGHLDVSLLNAALALQQSSITSYFADGELPVPSGSAAPYSAPNQAFETKEGWLMVAAYSAQRWASLCEVLELPQLANDPRFATSPLRVANRDAMTRELTVAFRRHTADEWIAPLQAADILCAKVASYADIAAHPQVAANAMLPAVEVPGFGALRMPGFPINSASANAAGFSAAPSCGQDTEAILRELGYGDAQIAGLVRDKAVSGPPCSATKPVVPLSAPCSA